MLNHGFCNSTESSDDFSFNPHKTKCSSKKVESVVTDAINEGVDQQSTKTIVENLKLPNKLYTSDALFPKVVQVLYELRIGISGEKVRKSLIREVPAPAVPPHNSIEVSDHRTLSNIPSTPPEVEQNSANTLTRESRKLTSFCDVL
jgi:hypothetical protein